MAERPNICYIFEKLSVQGCQIWHSHVSMPFNSAPAHSTRPHNAKKALYVIISAEIPENLVHKSCCLTVIFDGTVNFVNLIFKEFRLKCWRKEPFLHCGDELNGLRPSWMVLTHGNVIFDILEHSAFQKYAYVGSFVHFSVKLFFHVFCNLTKTSVNSSVEKYPHTLWQSPHICAVFTVTL